MIDKELDINIIAYFKANYIDYNNEKAKTRRHLSLKWKGERLCFFKLTSTKTRLSQRRIDGLECLDKPSYIVYEHQLNISPNDLKEHNYQHFHICPFHSDGCLNTEIFNEILQKMERFWKNKLAKGKGKRKKEELEIKASELEEVEKIPWLTANDN